MAKKSNGTRRAGQQGPGSARAARRDGTQPMASPSIRTAGTGLGAPKTGPRSLMKTSSLAVRGETALGSTTVPLSVVPKSKARRKASALGMSSDRNQKIEERIAAASEEL